MPPSNGTNSATPSPMDSTGMLTLATCMFDMRFAPKDVDVAVRLLLSRRGSILAKGHCRGCNIWVDAADADLVRYCEEWDSQEAFQHHLRSEEFRRVLIALDMCIEEPRVVVGNLSAGIGMGYLRLLLEKEAECALDGD
jgi:quinol monooxygenase YgiN